MELYISISVICVSILIIIWQIKTGWPGWLGMPFAIIALHFGLEVGISPWARRYFNVTDFIIGRALPREVPTAQGLLILQYGCIAAGMIIAFYLFSKRKKYSRPKRTSDTMASNPEYPWNCALVVFLIGVVLNLIVMAYLFRGGGIEYIMRRAAYTDEFALSSRLYQYCRVFSPAMLVGALGMIAFANKRKVNAKRGVLSGIFYIIFQIILGGRTDTVLSTASIIIIYHYAVERLNVKTILQFGGIVFLGLIFISFLRFGTETFVDSGMFVFEAIATPKRVDDVAFILRMVPEHIPHSGFAPALAGFSHAVPGLHIPGAMSTIHTVIEFILEGKNPFEGVSGTKFSTAAESYLQFGIAGVIGNGLIYGFIFGAIFEWQKRNRSNPYILIINALLIPVFFLAIRAKIHHYVGGFFVSSYLPVIFLAAISFYSKEYSKKLIIVLYSAATVYAGYRLLRQMGEPYFIFLRYTVPILLLTSYFFGVKLINSIPIRYNRPKR